MTFTVLKFQIWQEGTKTFFRSKLKYSGLSVAHYLFKQTGMKILNNWILTTFLQCTAREQMISIPIGLLLKHSQKS